MPTTPQPKPIADDISVDAAYQIGRRIYVKCGYESQLGGALRDIGAKWDRDIKTLWVGSTKRDAVLPLIKAHLDRLAQIQAIKDGRRWVHIPYDAAAIRDQAKALGAIWGPEVKGWAMPTDEAQATITAAVTQWTAARDAARAAERAAQDERERAERAATAQSVEDRIISRSGRTVVGEARHTLTGRLYGRMRRAEAEQAKPEAGEIHRLTDGRRVMIMTCTVRFWSQDAIDDGFTPDLSDDPGWYWTATGVEVEPTADEAEADRVEAARQADEAEIAQVVREVSRTAELSERGPDSPRVPAGHTITRHGGSLTRFPDGTVTLADDGQVWWYHPGYYDDYRAVQGQVVDEALIERVRAVVDGGSRERGPYTVTRMGDG